MTVTLNKGRTFVRSVIAKAIGDGNFEIAADYAASRWQSASAPIIKALNGSTTTEDTGSFESTEFFTTIVDRSLLGQLTGLRRIPFNTRYLKMTRGVRGYWAGSRTRIPVSKPAIAGGSLTRLKVASIAIFTKESLDAAGAIAEAAFQSDLSDAATIAIDAAFIDRANAGVVGTEPASVTHAAPAIAATTSAGVDVRAAIHAFGGDLSRAFWVTDGKTAAGLGLAQGADGGLLFPSVGARGGELLGVPVLTTEGSPYDEATGGQLALVDPTGIAANGDDIQVTRAEDAAIWVSDDPEGDPTLISLFQEDAVALKVVAYANWEQQRTGGAVVITGCKY